MMTMMSFMVMPGNVDRGKALNFVFSPFLAGSGPFPPASRIFEEVNEAVLRWSLITLVVSLASRSRRPAHSTP
jgi:hypothetical protein